MRVPVSWLADHVDLSDVDTDDLYAALVRVGLEVEQVQRVGHDVTGVVVGEVLDITELTGFKKPIRHCTVRVAQSGEDSVRKIVCGARNFAVGDRVAVAVPGAMLPGGFAIAARKTYGEVSEGMICSASELGAGDDHSGILILDASAPLGADVVELLGLRDVVLDIAVTPDRGYCLSMRGVAREAAIALGRTFRDPALTPSGVTDEPGGAGVEASLLAGDDAPLIVLRSVSDVDAHQSSPQWMRRRLELVGLRPIGLAVDVTNYLMHELGQPLHAFDRTRISGAITVRHAEPGERLTTLDHLERDLDPVDLLIADDSGPLSLAGTMGGLSSEIAAGTRELVIEAAHFRAGAVASMSRRHQLSSEASRRFERGVDPNLSAIAAARAVDLLVSLGGGRPGGMTIAGSVPATVDVVIDADLPARIVGVNYSAETVRTRLAEIGAAVSDVDTSGRLTVTPPSWRPDLIDQADLVEEVARLEGYEAIPELIPSAPAGGGLTLAQRRRRAVSGVVSASGLVEVLSPVFQSVEVLDGLGIAADDPRRALVRVANPLSDAESALRSSLLPGLLRVLARNVGRGNGDVAMYEIGRVFRDRPGRGPAPRPAVTARPSEDDRRALDAALPDQPEHFAAVFAGSRIPAGWWGPARATDWTDAVAAVRAAARAVGAEVVLHAEDRVGKTAPWHSGRCARIELTDGTVLGHAGELHPGVLRRADLPERSCAAEIDLGPLLNLPETVVIATSLSGFPVAVRDIAVVVEEAVAESDVAAAIAVGAGPLLESLQLFDVYAGDRVGAGLRSSGYALRFRAPDRTLTAEDVAAATDAALAEVKRATGGVLRS